MVMQKLKDQFTHLMETKVADTVATVFTVKDNLEKTVALDTFLRLNPDSDRTVRQMIRGLLEYHRKLIPH